METEYLKLIYDCLPGVIVVLVLIFLVLCFLAMMFYIQFFSDRHDKDSKELEYIESVCERYLGRELNRYFYSIRRHK